jgi:hypothetical protein
MKALRFRTALAGTILVAVGLLSAGAALAAQVNTAGKLDIPAGVPLFAVSTDPVIQYVLGQDFKVTPRKPGNGSIKPVTITVTVNQRVLKPGVTLGDLGPDPTAVASLLQKMGIAPPPLGDTAGQPDDPYAAMVRREAVEPGDPAQQSLREYEAMNQVMTHAAGPQFGPNGMAGESEIYNTVVIARVTASGSSGAMTAVAVVRPGGSLRAAKELIAEEIANAVLH